MAESKISAAQTPTYKVLVADSHPVNRDIVRRILAPMGASVTETSDGREALDATATVAFDLILLDITLGDRNGLSVLAQIKSFRPRQAVLIVSMHLEEVFAPICLRMGATGYLEKRYAMGELPVAINTIMSGGTYTSPRISSQSEALYYGHAS